MFGRNRKHDEDGADMRAIRDRATAESWPMNDPRAEYPWAEQFRQGRLEGAALAKPVVDESTAA